MIKKINIIFLLIISFSFCTSVFADQKQKRGDDLIENCLENKDLLECEEIPIGKTLGSTNIKEGNANLRLRSDPVIVK